MTILRIALIVLASFLGLTLIGASILGTYMDRRLRDNENKEGTRV